MQYNKIIEDIEVMKKINYVINRVKNNGGYVTTNFLDPYEQLAFEAICKSNKLNISFWDKGMDSERKIAIIFEDYYEEPKCTIYRVRYNTKYYSITHRDVLGALMNVGIKREMLGDILVNKQDIAFLCMDSVKGLIQEELTKIKNAPVTLEEIETFIKEDDGIEKKYIISSFRLDTLVATFADINREEAKERIKRKEVKVNHFIETDYKLVCDPQALISIKGFGRVQIIKQDGVTRKDNIVLITKVYTRKSNSK